MTALPSPNERLRIAVVGLGARGKLHIAALSRIPYIEIACVVDPDGRRHQTALRLASKSGPPPLVLRDVRDAIDRRDIDALTIASPNHWHAITVQRAAECGKHVLVEKPFCHAIEEGRRAVTAAEKQHIVLVHGAQRRAMRGYAGVVAFIRSGAAGKLLSARAICYRRRDGIGFYPDEPPPPELDYVTWTGPAAFHPYHRNLEHGNWHWFWAYGDGEIGAQGVHVLDVARWAMGDPTHPTRVTCAGGRFGYNDQAETPNTMVAAFDFDGVPLVYEQRGLLSSAYPGWLPSAANTYRMVGNVFELEGGTIVDRRFFPAGGRPPLDIPPSVGGPDDTLDGSIFEEFVRAIHTGLRTTRDQGYYSACLVHLANISYRLGDDVAFDHSPSPFGDAPVAADRWREVREHLKYHDLDLGRASFRVGRPLVFDPVAERFADADANRLLSGPMEQGALDGSW